ncbi:PREDICTED: ceramide-1-phosphate transfer protein, partial [Nicrophorus vespilloides]|uniref:Ceramide-1-phosphate transfer protein n=1 Tax=Nicrophorus vespilloides TaxID=110193 RepID=A0ABM1MH11_NICVS
SAVNYCENHCYLYFNVLFILSKAVKLTPHKHRESVQHIAFKNNMAEKFDLVLVHGNFKGSLCNENKDVDLKLYLDSYKELNKFFTLMGTMFGFVSKDLNSKLDILSELHKSDNENFSTVRRLIVYEKESNLLEKKGYVSGSRTLLRLHRGLDFIRLFLKYVSELQDDQNTGDVCRTAYCQTLEKFHSFLIAKGAKLAMYTMPIKADLMNRVCGNNEEALKTAIEILPQTLDVIAIVYRIIDDLYTEHDLHALP